MQSFPETIISTQTREIEQMESWLEAWYPELERLAASIHSTQTQEIRQMSQWMDTWCG